MTLHAHLPYVRHPEHDVSLEEGWLFDGLIECYLPLVDVLDRLERDGVPHPLALNVSPTLLEMLGDTLLMSRFEDRLGKLERLAAEVERERTSGALAPAIAHQREHLSRVRKVFEACSGRVAAAFARHAQRGSIELIASAATHAVLPLLVDVPEAVRAQVATGIDAYRRAFGSDPEGFWLPECAYAPEIEPFLAAAGIGYSIVDSHGVLDADPTPTRGGHRPILSPGGVAFFARDAATAEQVWSSRVGYPGDPRYREFHRDLGFEIDPERRERMGFGTAKGPLGMKLHRVTGESDAKEPYDRMAALAAVDEHARHFVALLASAARDHAGPGAPPVVLSAYDAELFGHWWFEGPEFLERVFRELAQSDGIHAMTPSQALRRWPECDVSLPKTSTWGRGGYFEVWLDPASAHVPPRLHEAATRMVRLARSRPIGSLAGRALAQAARELLLAQSSDWTFILAMGTTPSYANERIDAHLHAFGTLADAIERGVVDERLVRTAEEASPIFSFVDHRVYA